MGGVYKLVAIRKSDSWEPKIKISSNPNKTTIPGRKQLYRWESKGTYLGDCLASIDEPTPDHMRHPDIEYKQASLTQTELKPLLEDYFVNGRRVKPPRTLEESRQVVRQELSRFPAEHCRLSNPHAYRVGLSDRLYQLRQHMIDALRH